MICIATTKQGQPCKAHVAVRFRWERQERRFCLAHLNHRSEKGAAS